MWGPMPCQSKHLGSSAPQISPFCSPKTWSHSDSTPVGVRFLFSPPRLCRRWKVWDGSRLRTVKFLVNAPLASDTKTPTISTCWYYVSAFRRFNGAEWWVCVSVCIADTVVSIQRSMSAAALPTLLHADARFTLYAALSIEDSMATFVLFCFVWRLGMIMSDKEMEQKWWREKKGSSTSLCSWRRWPRSRTPERGMSQPVGARATPETPLTLMPLFNMPLQKQLV